MNPIPRRVFDLYPLPLIKGKGRKNKEGLTPLLNTPYVPLVLETILHQNFYENWLSSEMVVDYGEAVKELVTKLAKIS